MYQDSTYEKAAVRPSESTPRGRLARRSWRNRYGGRPARDNGRTSGGRRVDGLARIPTVEPVKTVADWGLGWKGRTTADDVINHNHNTTGDEP